MDENEKNEMQQEAAAAPEAVQQSEQFAGVETDELRKLYDDLKQQTKDLIGELQARHAAPEEEQGADWEGLFNSYRAPYKGAERRNDG